VLIGVREQERNQIVTDVADDVGLALDRAEYAEQGIDGLERIAQSVVETEQDHR
jgi:hypothetical protein